MYSLSIPSFEERRVSQRSSSDFDIIVSYLLVYRLQADDGNLLPSKGRRSGSLKLFPNVI